MGISLYNIRKWTKMLTGKSIMHVNQDMGRYFVPGEIKGYFNNMTEKVLKDPDTLVNKQIPVSTDEKAGKVYFPIAIFQYGLGAYDLYLGTKERKYYDQFIICTEWAFSHQKTNGAWDNFGFIQPDAPYSSMCQGEGASLLIRGFKETNNINWLNAAKQAIDFMLIPKEEGGTAEYLPDGIMLYEYTNKPCVLNGWIFSLYGLYDCSLVLEDDKYKDALRKTIERLCICLPDFDNGYWSMYDLGGLLTSPFYHDLHIAQLQALYITFNIDIFEKYQNKFIEYKKNCIKKNLAFMLKAVQKIKEP